MKSPCTGRPTGRQRFGKLLAGSERRSRVRAALVAAAPAAVAAAAPASASAATNPGTGNTGFFTFVGGSSTEHVQVNVASGNLLVTEHDLRDSAANYHVVVDRYYNGLASTAFSILGPRWSFDVGPATQLSEAGNGTVTVTGPSGYTLASFTPHGDGSYDRPDGFDGDLSRADSGWVLSRDSVGDSFRFDSGGQLVGTTDAASRAFNVQNTSAAGRTVLSSYGTPDGRRVNLSYTGDSLVRELDDPSSGHHYYTYTSGRLTRYQGTGGDDATYSYDANGLLNAATYSDGTGFSTTNLADGRVATLTWRPGGVAASQTWSYNYATPGQTTVTGPDGSTTTYTYTAAFRVTGPAPADPDPGQPDPNEIVDEPSLGLVDSDPAWYGQQSGAGINTDEPPDVGVDLAADGGQAGARATARAATADAQRYRVQVNPNYLGQWALIRNDAQTLMTGNARNGWAFDRQVDKLGRAGTLRKYYWGRFRGLYQGCGWISRGNVTDPRTGPSLGACTTYNGANFIPASRFASLINCDNTACGQQGTKVPLRADAPVYRNIQPFSSHRGESKGTEALTLSATHPVPAGSPPGTVGTPTTVFWRYITPGPNRYIAVYTCALGVTAEDRAKCGSSDEQVRKQTRSDFWGFIPLSSVLAPGADYRTMCFSLGSTGPMDTMNDNHDDWPQVCAN